MVPQQILTSLHRMRSGWVAERTARINALRGLLREFGLFIPVGGKEVVPPSGSSSKTPTPACSTL